MAWFRYHYHCSDCGEEWDDEWSCSCDDDCPECRSRHWSPVSSDDLTWLIKPKDGVFLVLESPVEAAHKPGYIERAVAFSRETALEYVSARKVTY